MNNQNRFLFWGILLIVVLLSISSITFPIFVAQTVKSQNVICIDAGHGGSDPGKVGNLNIFKNDPAAVISIHQNSYPSSDVHGAQVFYPQGSEKSKQLADCIQSALVNGLDSTNHRLAKANTDYYLFRNNPYPIVIVECGFLSNPEELKLLQDDKYQQKAVKCIFTGLKNYLGD